MVKMKCKTTGMAVTVQPSLAEKGYWLVTYHKQYIHTFEEVKTTEKGHWLVTYHKAKYIHTFEEVKTWYENN